MSDWKKLNAHRLSLKQDPNYGSEPSDGFNGFFCLVLNALRVKCLASDGEGWRHVSVSIEGHAGSLPSWSIMCQVKDLFWEPEDWVVQFHPAKSEYVDVHPGVLHLWQPLNAEFPKPNRLMVGPKDEADVKTIEADERVPLMQRIATRLAFNARKETKL